ncbi:hypothetical protein H6F86_09890 [Phormidium sp. FACHB-592]|uniref:Uncharacterized protein n=1 Tax=Stenomitos frigidus AS-A4 TaxID=2933935 RepID=A0ABV0KRV5_9CYAN|nr:hypothetical protein [Phormidium sp. FACHB-592]MBD2074197.1 hypothetical protein [Phormidium sp. FACHB-592]
MANAPLVVPVLSESSTGTTPIRKTELQQFGNNIHAVYVMSRPVAATASHSACTRTISSWLVENER